MTFVKYNKDLLQEVIDQCESFKIGKTGKTLEERFAEPDYCDTYREIKSLLEAPSKSPISVCESMLIDTYKDNPKCDNEKDGKNSFNDEMTDSSSYRVYVVWR